MPETKAVEATPRPWKVEVHDARGDYARIVLVSRSPKFECSYYVIAADDMAIRREQAIADFRLIAAMADSYDANTTQLAELREAALQSRTLISTLKHLDDLDRMSLNAAVDLTLYKLNKALRLSQEES